MLRSPRTYQKVDFFVDFDQQRKNKKSVVIRTYEKKKGIIKIKVRSKSVWFGVSVFSALPRGLRRVRNFELRFPNWFWNVYFFEYNQRRCHWMRLRLAKFPAKMKKKKIFLRVFSFSICSQIDAWSFGTLSWFMEFIPPKRLAKIKNWSFFYSLLPIYILKQLNRCMIFTVKASNFVFNILQNSKGGFAWGFTLKQIFKKLIKKRFERK